MGIGGDVLDRLPPGVWPERAERVSWANILPSAEPRSLSLGNRGWSIDPGFLHVLDAVEAVLGTPSPGGLPSVRVLGSEVVKTGPHRTVTRLRLESGEYYLKQFRIAGWRSFFQNLVRPCKAELEWRAVRRVAELGLPTVQPIAVGRTWKCGLVWENYLVTRSVDGAVSLDQFLGEELDRLQPAVRRTVWTRLADSVGDLMGRMHARGAVHPDLHPGNLLVRLGQGLEVELWLIDLHGVQFRGEVSIPRSARSLAALNQLLEFRLSRSDRRRFFRAYCRARGWDDVTEKTFARPFEQWCGRATRALLERADRAWRRGNRHQQLLESAQVACRGLATLDADWLLAVRTAPEALFEQGLQWWCKRSGKRRVAAVTVPAPPGWTRAYWKAIEHSGWRWLDRLRGSPVRRAWETGHAFLRRGIATPRPLLFVEAHGPKSDRCYLLTEAVPDSLTLAEFCRTTWQILSREEQRDWLAGTSRTLARQLRWMHACRFDHRDLKFENILVPAGTDRVATWLLDLDAVRRWPMLPSPRRAQNLARLNVSTLHLPTLGMTDRLRFLKDYLGPREWPHWKTWWQAIVRRSERKQRQNKLRGRPLS